MVEKIPRRMQRFYRNREESGHRETDYSKQTFDNTNDFEETKIPSMDYEDVNLDENTLKKMKELEKMNLEQKIASLEVEKFKKKHNRLPNENETKKMADSLFTQFKENPELFSEQGENTLEKNKGRSRFNRNRKKVEQEPVEENFNNPEDNTPIGISPKDLFSDSPKKNSDKNEFELGLDFENDSGLDVGKDDIEEIKEFDEKNCPNCGKKTEKIIYCSNCGTAYCKNCSKENNCPKCGKKN